MKQELQRHLYPLLIIFLLCSLVWIFKQAPFWEFVGLFLGLTLGSFFLNLDHLIFWLYVEPNLEESKSAQAYLSRRDYKSLFKLFKTTHHQHTNLIFHHFFFQIILCLVSIFVITSSGSSFAKSFILALNLHLLIDEYYDFKSNPEHLQNWLFARETKQIPLANLKHYLIGVTVICSFFSYLLIRSQG